uniref:ATP synthase F0 subunit 6 n=1 Tax=Potamometra macrokosos TaxID=2853723 RepID=UPI001EDEAEA4|nr:ATP synthase F0 subunit 6 [Potamometra macrokosos]UJY96839.1 ATP synthase F0 subunit 6 [Potamometra macrokosos]UJY96852.1 ATP synthase F0 subunit 6 [Potamometra macrokosos]UJY96865.1 ATP synthase F0 subunit 6 [Potamometra macrokosos]UJY96878.1 ATP synthase F0 subunit 6 [Potamometra macrokosos]
MMTNLFSTFDPSTSMNYSMNWLSTMIIFIMFPYSYWMMKSRYTKMIQIIYTSLHLEFKTLLNKSNGLTLMMTSIFMFILVNNMLGLLPYIFTSTSHLICSLAMSLPLWLSIMLFGWIKKTQHMFSHLIPAGTPGILMPFMVCIETISNIIRPGSLAVRLTANMIAGHLLMSLLGNNTTNASTIVIMMLMTVQISLMLFETAVAIIQAYVFSILTTLYSSEVN